MSARTCRPTLVSRPKPQASRRNPLRINILPITTLFSIFYLGNHAQLADFKDSRGEGGYTLLPILGNPDNPHP